MLSVAENLLVFCLVAAVTVGFLWGLNHFWPRESRRPHNDMVGWQLSIVGTIYAVILGFMLYTVWNAYTVADTNVDLEANAAVDIYRLAGGLPGPQREQLREETRRYARTVIEQDWPEMDRSEVPEASTGVSSAMWQTLLATGGDGAREVAVTDHAITQVIALTEHRRDRILQSQSRLPAVLWSVLILGGVLTVVSACLFGGSSNLLHSIQVSALALLIALVLLAVADIYRPFQGSVHISSYAFERALVTMQAE